MASSYLPTKVLTHTQKVCSLYKRALRNIESSCLLREQIRFNFVVMRQRFELHRHEKDLRISKQMVIDGEEELFQNMHNQPQKFFYSPGGIGYGREVHPPDVVLDFWHPLEKAQYPEYFARRELRKQQYIENWEKEYGKPQAAEGHH